MANAFAPVLESAANLGYTDVVFNPVTGAYERTLTEAGVPTPFMSFPDIDWGQVPGVLFNQLLAGIEKEFLSGNPTPGTPNALTNLLGFLGGLGGLEGLLGGLGLEDLLGDIVGGLNPLGLTEGATTFAAATDLPDENARTFTLSTEETQVDESQSGTGTSTTTEEDTTEQETTEEDATGEDATDEDATGEDATDEDATDEDATDEDITDQDAKGETKAGSTTPNHPGISVSSIVRGMTKASGRSTPSRTPTRRATTPRRERIRIPAPTTERPTTRPS